MLWLVPIIIGSALITSDQTASIPYFSPSDNKGTSWDYAQIGVGTIPLDARERIVMYDLPAGLRALNIIALINMDFESVLENLRLQISESYGVAQSRGGPFGNFGDKSTSAPAGGESLSTRTWPPLGQGLNEFSLLGMRFDLPQEHELRSQLFHQNEKADHGSEVTIRVSDGSGLFKQNITIIQMTRQDHSIEWMRLVDLGLHSLLPLPFRTKRSSFLVTDTEIGMIDQLKRSHSGTRIYYFLPYPGFKNPDHKARFLSGITEAARQF